MQWAALLVVDTHVFGIVYLRTANVTPTARRMPRAVVTLI